VELRIKGDYVTCGIDSDHSFQIGVDAPNDYRWLKMARNRGNKSLTVGDGDDFGESGDFWLKPDDQIQLTQTACFGSQIAADANNANNRWNTNPWGEDKESDTDHNKQFTLTSGLDSRTFFNGVAGASSSSSHTGSSFRGSEIGITDFSKSSTPSSRIDNRYRLESTSNWGQVSNLGSSLNTSFSTPSGDSVNITAKIPYNYYLNLSLDSNNGVID
jgi:hypothetical protein